MLNQKGPVSDMDSNGIIDIMNTCFMVCLAFAILFLVISIILFFLFDIRTIFNIKTGRAQAKTVKEMQVANASTGRLRVGGKTQTSKLTKEQKNKNRAPAVISPSQAAVQQNFQTSYTDNAGSAETELLQQDAGETEILNKTALQSSDIGNTPISLVPGAETSVLNQSQYNDIDNAKDIHFVITKKIICIHTDEIIN